MFNQALSMHLGVKMFNQAFFMYLGAKMFNAFFMHLGFRGKNVQSSFLHALSLQITTMLVLCQTTFGGGLAFSAAIKAGIKPRRYNN